MSAVSLPSIWTPQRERSARARSWAKRLREWRDRLTLFTDGKGQLNANGRGVIHTGNGKAAMHTATNDDCDCTCNQPCPCVTCLDNKRPCTATITSADIDYTLCDGVCIPNVKVGFYGEVSGPTSSAFSSGTELDPVSITDFAVNPNGVFMLSGTANDNLFSGGSSGSGTFPCSILEQTSDFCFSGNPQTTANRVGDDFSSFGGGFGPDAHVGIILGGFAGCYDAITPFDDWRIWWGWVLAKSSTKWYLAYMTQFSIINNFSAGTGFVDFSVYRFNIYQFYGMLDTTDGADCSTTLSFSNSLTGCAAFQGVFDNFCTPELPWGDVLLDSGGVSVGSGGTAVVVFTNS